MLNRDEVVSGARGNAVENLVHQPPGQCFAVDVSSPSAGAITARVAPISTWSPCLTSTSLTPPAAAAVTECSIFIASIHRIGWPAHPARLRPGFRPGLRPRVPERAESPRAPAGRDRRSGGTRSTRRIPVGNTRTTRTAVIRRQRSGRHRTVSRCRRSRAARGTVSRMRPGLSSPSRGGCALPPSAQGGRVGSPPATGRRWC